MTAITHWELKQMQSLPLHMKIHKTCARIQEWYDFWNGDIYVAFSGGLDSTVLSDIVHKLYPEVPLVFSNTGLEYPEIVDFVNTCNKVEVVRPKHSFKWVLDTYGYPVVTKDVSKKLYELRTGKSETNKNRILNGDYKGNGKIPEKWKFLIDAPFKISDKCCFVIKKQPSMIYENETGRKQINGTLAADSRLRMNEYLKRGCNGFESKREISTPMAFWTRQDVLAYLVIFNVKFCSIYGDIIYDPITKTLKTTGIDHTGCYGCMFGVHVEKHPNRFERMKVSHPKHYAVCMNLGCGKVMDYIGVRH
jgi:3'-phosphoadenosine 5'-phosphosulfate sulfotransferase (PAPS reductase)/FAD synthetase